MEVSASPMEEQEHAGKKHARRDPSPEETLSAAHLAAIEPSLAGKTHAEAAAAAGVHRNTISAAGCGQRIKTAERS